MSMQNDINSSETKGSNFDALTTRQDRSLYDFKKTQHVSLYKRYADGLGL